MKLEIIKIIIELIVFDIGIWVSASSQEVGKLERKQCTFKLARNIFSDTKKDTKLHFSILIINPVILLLEVVSAFLEYQEGHKDFGQAFTDIANQVNTKRGVILIWIGIIALLTFFFMFITYRAVKIKPIIDDGKRRLNVSEIDKEYIEFSKSDSIDGHSTLLLIAGDLSFLGDIPDTIKIKNVKKRIKCKEILSGNCSEQGGCTYKKCPASIKNDCIVKSDQFAQLLELRKKGIIFQIICKEPNASNDIQYKRRLGFLKKIFSDNLVIHFLPKDTLESGICVLGRIKVNGGIKQLFWHWKDPEQRGYYIVPETKRIDSSESKTLIYLLGTVLWEFANEAEESMMRVCLEEYEKAIK